MKRASVVIGAGYGDEGKGNTTDKLCSPQPPSEALVVRFSGGANASHTVNRSGKRHAFSHFGSGTLYGCDTYLDENFLLNPILFRQEWEQLQALDVQMPKIYAHRYCKVTTPYDMGANQMDTTNLAHGSCGVGIHATEVRENTVSFRAHHCLNEMVRLVDVRQFYNAPYSFAMETNFLDDVRFMMDRITLLTDRNALYSRYEHVVFEGSQGLQIDRGSPNFPHVTDASVGLTNIVQQLDQFRDVTIYYVTRAYQTKHGAGPFNNEADLSEWFDIVDKTNVWNTFQGSIRYAPLCPVDLAAAIERDQQNLTSRQRVIFEKVLVVTCIDQAKTSVIPYVLPLPHDPEQYAIEFLATDALKNMRGQLGVDHVITVIRP